MTVEVLDKQFQLYARPQIDATKSYTLNEDGSLTIEGIASTTSKDLQDDIVTPTCIESMKRQLLSGLNLHGDHWYGLFDGVIGAIKEVIPTDTNSLRIKAVILPKYAQDIKDMINIGVKLGLSIGGRVTEYITLEDGGWEILDIALREISLTAMPANWDTYGTITTSKGLVKSTCLTGACHMIMKNEVMNMTKEEKIKDETQESLTKQDVVDLINESLVSTKEEILNDTVQVVSKQLDKIVKDAISSALAEKAEDEEENKPEEEEEEEEKPQEEEEEEKSSIDIDSIKNIFHEELKTVKSEILESIPKTDMDAVHEAIKSAVSEETDKLFKNLDSQREPTFSYQEENIETPEEPTVKSEFTASEIAEQLVAKQNKEDFIKSLL